MKKKAGVTSLLLFGTLFTKETREFPVSYDVCFLQQKTNLGVGFNPSEKH